MLRPRPRVIALRFGNIGEVAENASCGCRLAQILPNTNSFCTGFLRGTVVPQQRFGNGQPIHVHGNGRTVSVLASQRHTFPGERERRGVVPLAVTDANENAERVQPHRRAAAG